MIEFNPVKWLAVRLLVIVPALLAWSLLNFKFYVLMQPMVIPGCTIAIVMTLVFGFVRQARGYEQLSARVDQTLALLAKVAYEAVERREEQARRDDGEFPVQ